MPSSGAQLNQNMSAISEPMAKKCIDDRCCCCASRCFSSAATSVGGRVVNPGNVVHGNNDVRSSVVTGNLKCANAHH